MHVDQSIRHARIGPARSRRLRDAHWPTVLCCGTGLWLAAIAVTAVTSNALLLPTDILAGSFVVPVTAVVWIFEHAADSTLAPRRVLLAFVVGGGLSMLLAVLVEHWSLPSGGMRSVSVGLIEEVAKATLVMIFAAGLARFGTRSGMLLGSAVGFGYAALESSGYALNAFNGLLAPGRVGDGLIVMFQVESDRAIFAPVLHGLWTSVLGGIMFRTASRTRRLRVIPVMIGALFLVVAVHASWDAMDDVAAFVAAATTHSAVSSTLESVASAIALTGCVADCLTGAAAAITIWRAEHRPTGAAATRVVQYPTLAAAGTQLAPTMHWSVWRLSGGTYEEMPSRAPESTMPSSGNDLEAADWTSTRTPLVHGC